MSAAVLSLPEPAGLEGARHARAGDARRAPPHALRSRSGARRAADRGVRRASREAGRVRSVMSAPQSDALVFFGATGDLAYKKIFPSLQAMVKRGHLDVPVIGVAKAGWTLDQMRARARDSLEKHGGLDATAFAKLSAQLRYVDGDYNDPATFAALRKELGNAKRPAHYLAIPPVLFGKVVGQCCVRLLGGRARHRREAVRHRPRVGPGAEQRDPLLGVSGACDLPHRPLPGEEAGPQHALRPLHQRLPRADPESQPRRERADHDGGELRGARPRRVLRPDRDHPRRDPEPPVPGPLQPGDGAAGSPRRRVHPRREGEGVEGDAAAHAGEHGARPVQGLPCRARRQAGVHGGDLRRAEAGDRLVAMARRAVLTSALARTCLRRAPRSWFGCARCRRCIGSSN